MAIGLDFDNTIACYDAVYRAIVETMDVVPPETPANKTAIRDWLRAKGREPEWTELQGYIYGDGMTHAKPFPGVLEFLATCRSGGIPVYIISHRTRMPYAGPQVDLHATARAWLETHELAGDDLHLLSHDRIFFELTKEDKHNRIARQECRWFVDDLPEFLADDGFPAQTQPILFDPHETHAAEAESKNIERVSSWAETASVIFALRDERR